MSKDLIDYQDITNQQMHDEARKLLNNGLENESIIEKLCADFKIDSTQAQKVINHSVDDLYRKKAFYLLLGIGVFCIVSGSILKLIGIGSYFMFGSTPLDLIIGLIIVGFGFVISSLRQYKK
jgi:hypothetical protein